MAASTATESLAPFITPTKERWWVEVLAASSATQPLRYLVSGSKLRTVDGGFDLDLTYVTPQIIALGLPASGVETFYRNPLSEVRAFLSRHAGHYAMVNLCDERDYPNDEWPGAKCIMRYPFPDHHPPALCALVHFCERAAGFLDADAEHVLAVDHRLVKVVPDLHVVPRVRRDVVHSADERTGRGRCCGARLSVVTLQTGAPFAGQWWRHAARDEG